LAALKTSSGMPERQVPLTSHGDLKSHHSPHSGPHTACWLYRMDVPKAPKLLGALVGLGVAENAVPIGKVADLYGKVEDTESRRQGVAEVLLYLKVCALPSS
jgi:hypothetical protein